MFWQHLREDTDKNVDLLDFNIFHPEKGQTTVLLTCLLYQWGFFKFA